ncbi:trigger factor [Polymorphobacter glacialis]|uniref:Trigger factor n=1 Tax=Sandarakinorhabdus glacialis TaxID=1614636 RepID=A0A917A3P4_9SPHN|nr:trigger factor [Polymorphobacter glacialis]GGE22431.1 trigger factor [Polymorphobacter glacialis]
MQIAETLNQGLRREYSLVIPAAALAARVDARLAEVSKTIRMPGFRPGKVPPNLVRKMHGEALRGEALQAAVNDGVQQLLSQHQLRPANQPQVDLQGEVAEGADVGFKVAMEILPTLEDVKIDDLALEKLVVGSDEIAVDEAIKRLAGQQQRTEAAAPAYEAKTGDTLVIDFEGRVDGELFDGGKGEGMRVKIGSGSLIPGFEDQLVGAKANDERTVKVSFPEDYNVAYLKGKPAEFAIVVQAVETPVEAAIDDEFAKNFGIDSLDALKEILKEQLDSELGSLTRTHMKRKLLDTLASRHDFEVPETMVSSEFDQIWAQLDQEAAQDADPAAARAQLEGERADYRRIAERRVRLGLLLSEIGQRNSITVSQAEMNRLIGQEAARYPGEQQQVVKFFQENAMAAAQLRAPLYEDKVVDFLLSKAEVTERSVTRADLEAAIEDEDETPGSAHIHDHAGHDHAGHVHGPDCGHDHAPVKAKAVKGKAAAFAAPEAEAVADVPVKKAAKAKAAKAEAAPSEPVVDVAAPVAEAAKPKPKAAKKVAE